MANAPLDNPKNMVGSYGTWLSDKVLGDGPAKLSFRNGKYKNINEQNVFFHKGDYK